MFTGIIETQGVIKKIETDGSNKIFWIKSSISSKLRTDQSVSHDGVCLTVESVKKNSHRVTAISETLSKSTLGSWEKGQLINLERCLKLNERLDGHLVQGHVDCIGKCLAVSNKQGSWQFTFEIPSGFSELIIEKGSIALNGISLTLFNVKKNQFDVAIIPYTLEHTNLKNINVGSELNIEFDMAGKYLLRKLSLVK